MSSTLLAADPRILPALATPLTPAGQLDVASAERLIDHLYRRGIGGLYVTGSTGEGIYLDAALRKRIVEIAVSMSLGRGTVIVHVGAIQAALAMELAEHAGQVGADAVSSIPPFVGGYTWDEVRSFYAELARRSPVPVVAYYIPGLTGQHQSIDNLARLLAIPNIAGFKYTDLNLFSLQRLSLRLAPNQILYNGYDELLSLGLQMGAHGGIGTTYNVIPELIVQVYRLCQAGRWTEAVAVQKQVNDVIEPMLGVHILAATKQVLYWQGLIDHTACALPRAALSETQQSELRQRLSGTAIAGTLIR
jgi:N-acetylneuraminate lyase